MLPSSTPTTTATTTTEDGFDRNPPTSQVDSSGGKNVYNTVGIDADQQYNPDPNLISPIQSKSISKSTGDGFLPSYKSPDSGRSDADLDNSLSGTDYSSYSSYSSSDDRHMYDESPLPSSRPSYYDFTPTIASTHSPSMLYSPSFTTPQTRPQTFEHIVDGRTLPTLQLPPQADEDTPLLIRTSSSESIPDESTQTNAIEFLVSMDTDWKVFVIRIIAVALASVVFVSTFVDWIPLHIFLTGPVAIYAVAVALLASSHIKILSYLLKISAVLLGANIIALLVARHYTLLLWDGASVVLLLISSLSIQDLISTHNHLINKYTHEYLEAARTNSSVRTYSHTNETPDSTYYNRRFSMSSTEPTETPRWANTRMIDRERERENSLATGIQDNTSLPDRYAARRVSGDVSYDTDSPTNFHSPIHQVYLPSDQLPHHTVPL